MLQKAIVGLGRRGADCLRGGARNLRKGKLRGVLLEEGCLRDIVPKENIRALTTAVPKKNMALEVREELRKKASF